MKPIKIAVASGKGGTGKTMVATSLADSIPSQNSVFFLDCDVEAPNAHLFLKPEFLRTKPAIINVPVIDDNLCTACGRCVQGCEFNALAQLNGKIKVFPQLCHGCGNCSLLCPEGAIHEKPRQIGTLSEGVTESGIQYFQGELTISEPMPTPIINQLKHRVPYKVDTVSILDSPPGASCPVVATVHDADYVLLVTEPTPFGMHDLKQMLGILAQTGSPGGIIINRDGIGDDRIKAFLTGTPYPVLIKIPYQRNIAVGLAQGELLTKRLPEYKTIFIELFRKIMLAILSENFQP